MASIHEQEQLKYLGDQPFVDARAFRICQRQLLYLSNEHVYAVCGNAQKDVSPEIAELLSECYAKYKKLENLSFLINNINNADAGMNLDFLNDTTQAIVPPNKYIIREEINFEN